jgi:predicted  nucleic acid-binding Zn-ribbon protein
MGVPVGEAAGEHIATLVCRNCETRYETDETMGNDCPGCGVTSFDIVDSEASDR